MARRVGSYELEEQLGSGGMGTVHRARHVELGHRVALKTIRPEIAAVPEAATRLRRSGSRGA